MMYDTCDVDNNDELLTINKSSSRKRCLFHIWVLRGNMFFILRYECLKTIYIFIGNLIMRVKHITSIWFLIDAYQHLWTINICNVI